MSLTDVSKFYFLITVIFNEVRNDIIEGLARTFTIETGIQHGAWPTIKE